MLQIIKITLLKNKKVVFLTMILVMISCADNVEFTKYKSVQNSSWEANKKVSFEFAINDTILPKNLFINIRNNKDYKYSNLYLITELTFPNETKIIDTLHYEMADNTGRFLGSGFTDVKVNKLFYKEKKVFPQSGNYNVNIRHAMRKNGEVNIIQFLEGIQDVGLSIEKLN